MPLRNRRSAAPTLPAALWQQRRDSRETLNLVCGRLIDLIVAHGQPFIDFLSEVNVWPAEFPAKQTHDELDSTFDKRFVFWLARPCRHNNRAKILGKGTVGTIDLGIVAVAAGYALLETIGHRDFADTAKKLKHPHMGANEVVAFLINCRLSINLLTKPQNADEHYGFKELASLNVDPFHFVAGVVDLRTLAGLKEAVNDKCLLVLRKFFMKLIEESFVTNFVYCLFRPDEREWVAIERFFKMIFQSTSSAQSGPRPPRLKRR